jgi:dTDP-4-amino-4,6-dideoxygalactose transaminase
VAIAFIDLQAQRKRIADKIDAGIKAVLEDGRFIMGPWVAQFEKELAAFCGGKHALSCANGTDALVLPLMAWGVGEGDAVFCPSFTFVATAEILPWVGASPVFVDVKPDTYNMDPASLEAAIEATIKAGKLKPKVIIAVDLFGQPADYPAIQSIARKYGLKLIADSAQGFGCTLNGKHPIEWADAVTTSFFPAKPLGCYGDGGAVITNDAALWDLMDSIRVHGKASNDEIKRQAFDHDPKYLNVRVGLNSRLDSIQAAVLIEKLKIFSDENIARNRIADRYAEGLKGAAVTPKVIKGGWSVWAQYTIEVKDRDGLAAHLKSKGIPTAAYYPIPIHQQRPYAGYPTAPGGLPVTDEKAGKVIALPMHPYLDEATQDLIVSEIRAFVGRNSA